MKSQLCEVPKPRDSHLRLADRELSPGKVKVCQRAEGTNKTKNDCNERVKAQGPRVTQAARHCNDVVGTGGVSSDCGTFANVGCFCGPLVLS